MNLIFVSSGEYPNGGAASNRHLAYAKGLVEAGHNVTFILLSKHISKNNEFVEDGIRFIPTFPENYDSNYGKIKKLFRHIQAQKARKKIILQIHRNNKIDAIILLDTLIWILFPIIRIAKNHRIKLFHERTEYPFVVGGKGLIMRINQKIYSSYVLKKFDGIYVISHALMNYFNQILNRKVPVGIINMIVDPSRFNEIAKNDIPKYRYIAYCGSLNENKDGVITLIKAFSEAIKSKKIANAIKLVLIGDAEDQAFKTKLEGVLEEEKCRNYITFISKVERSEIPNLLNGAAALALARPNSKQAEGGFPTKLGEYLATGKPVIITNVGEICLFLKDGINSFVAKPGDVESFLGKIAEVFSDYPKALEIGQRGKDLAYNEFNYRIQAEKLASFIESNQT